MAKILVVLSRVPYPLEKGDKLRAYHIVRQLSLRHEVVLFCLSEDALHPKALSILGEYCSDIRIVRFSKWRARFQVLWTLLFDKIPLQVGYFYFKRAQRELDQFVEMHQPASIYCQLIRVAPYVAEYSRQKKGKLILDYMDVFSKGAERWASSSSFFLRPFLFAEYRRLLRYEKAVFALFDITTIISYQDRDLLPVAEKQAVQVIPNGVDTVFFHEIPLEKDIDILFNGNMNYPPNIESVEYLVNKILPLVQAVKPEVRVLISGAQPHPRVLALQSDNVNVTGWVDDIRTSFARSRILVAPMSISIGLQNKLLEAMAMKIPCVTSSLSNNAIKANPGTQIVVADTPQQYADAIVNLLDHPHKAKEMAEQAYDFVIHNYNWDSVGKRLNELL